MNKVFAFSVSEIEEPTLELDGHYDADKQVWVSKNGDAMALTVTSSATGGGSSTASASQSSVNGVIVDETTDVDGSGGDYDYSFD